MSNTLANMEKQILDILFEPIYVSLRLMNAHIGLV